MSHRFLGNVIITGTIRCETGLHIGGTVEGYEIGGMDNPIIRDPVTGYPYIPGSSLKGKMRSLLEWARGKVQVEQNDGEQKQQGNKKNDEDKVGAVHSCSKAGCDICRIFGAPAEEDRKVGPTRLLVRDAYPTEKTRENLDGLQSEKGLPKAEWKSENFINRVTARATPRTIERIPKGSEFEFELVYGVYQLDTEQEMADVEYLKSVFEAMRLLQDSALGGYGSRGSGKISFQFENQVTVRTIRDYERGGQGETCPVGTLEKPELAQVKQKFLDAIGNNETANPAV